MAKKKHAEKIIIIPFKKWKKIKEHWRNDAIVPHVLKQLQHCGKIKKAAQ